VCVREREREGESVRRREISYSNAAQMLLLT